MAPGCVCSTNPSSSHPSAEEGPVREVDPRAERITFRTRASTDDMLTAARVRIDLPVRRGHSRLQGHRQNVCGGQPERCLLYTSDAADEEDSVDLGGRRIIKKK